MKLLTADIIRKLRKSPLYSHEKDAPEKVEIIVKFFTPDSNWTWFVTEGRELEDGDWLFFGMVHGFEKELGYFQLSELKKARGNFGLPIERDMYYGKHFLSEVL